MTIKNTQDISKYPENYDWLTEEQQESIINYMNEIDSIASNIFIDYKKALKNNETENANALYEDYNMQLSEITGAKNAYYTISIMVERNWLGKTGWILATKEDAIANETYEEPQEDQPIQPVLLSYGDVGQ